MKDKFKLYLALHLILLFYSTVGILGKLASQQEFFSFSFFLLYGGELLILGCYAIVWQQILKRMPLSFAYANRAVMIIWGCLWSSIIFHEQLTLGKAAGCLLVLCGIALYGIADGKAGSDE